ncbi:hypothetical protein R50073_19800 [Maricurvus nonylphenolicus]|uniref:DUF1254 domain-containing protein n=1 Tax=Maricurvus nonylphenolicus TaxID=1008307 RepID=UPI0036F43603
MINWKRYLLISLALAVPLHVMAVWAIPYGVMLIIQEKSISTDGAKINKVLYKDMITENDRIVIRPSPDVLYSGMVFDVSSEPLLISAKVIPNQYWMLNFHDIETSNFAIIDDREVKDGEFKLILASQTAKFDNTEGIQVLRAPNNRGLMLNRLVIPDRSMAEEYKALQRSLIATPFK